MLGLPFIAVMPASTSPEKIALIEFHGGRCHLVDDPAKVVVEARWLAEDCGGHFMDQFTYAERATDWRGNNNIAESIYAQLALERHPVPAWIVVGAGTGGTSATIGRYARYRRLPTRLCVVDPENSAFCPGVAAPATGGRRTGRGSRIEGIGRPAVEASFLPCGGRPDDPGAGRRVAGRHAGRLGGRSAAGSAGSTGTNLWGAFGLIAGAARAGPDRLGGHADLRRRRAVRRHLLRRRLGGRPGPRPGSAPGHHRPLPRHRRLADLTASTPWTCRTAGWRRTPAGSGRRRTDDVTDSGAGQPGSARSASTGVVRGPGPRRPPPTRRGRCRW